MRVPLGAHSHTAAENAAESSHNTCLGHEVPHHLRFSISTLQTGFLSTVLTDKATLLQIRSRFALKHPNDAQLLQKFCRRVLQLYYSQWMEF